MKFTRIFTSGLSHPLEGITFETRTSQLRNMDGTSGSSEITLKVPSDWSQMA
jgi:ribonucleoside-diphosphate reductase alpha chain